MEYSLAGSILMKIIDILGNVFIKQVDITTLKKHKELEDQYYNKLLGLAKEEKEEIVREEEKEEETATFCLACVKDHLSTVSAALNEALRFARDKGIGYEEVINRIGIATDELNIMERIDLSSDKIIKLSEEDKEIANWVLKESRKLRHKITEIRTVKDLEEVAGQAAELRTQYLKKFYREERKESMEFCEGLEGEKREKCLELINKISSLGKCKTCKI